MENYKTCSKCSQTKLINLFSNKKTGKYGVSAICKTCDAIQGKKWRENNPDRKKQSDRNWQINNKSKKRESQRRWEQKNAEKEKMRKRLYYLENKDEFRKKNKIWSKNNREKENAKKKRWRENNPERVRIEYSKRRSLLAKNGTYLVTQKDLKKLNKNLCFYCKKTDVKLTLDHIIPVVKGGRHSIGNLVFACQSCNSSKGAKFYMEWKLESKCEPTRPNPRQR
jgi:5-methylcytosine-specific restriction endonuclease McrA